MNPPGLNLIDNLYAKEMATVPPFVFNTAVAQVFLDMIRRSVPGYDTLIQLSGTLAASFSQPDSLIYDLGCSLGATATSTANALKTNCRIIAVDSSQAMIKQATQHGPQELPITWLCADIRTLSLNHASVVTSILTLQFLPREDRQALIDRIYQALAPEGALVLAEKICFADQQMQTLYDQMHADFKHDHGYSNIEIKQKRQSLKHVMSLDTEEEHIARLRASGFSTITIWFRCLNFIALLALP